MSCLFLSGGQNIRASASASVLPVNIQDWFPSEMKERRFNPHHRNTKDHKRLLHTILCQQIGQARRKRLKSRDITLPTKVHIVKAKVFPVVMYECESWTIKKAKCCRIDAFELWCWRRLLRVPWTARSNQSILKEINPEYPLEGQMLKLKLQYFGHLIQRTDSLEKILMLGKIEGRRRRGRQRMRWLDGIPDSIDMGLSNLQER